MEFKGVVELTVEEAKDLIAADKTGTSDPYCIVTFTGNPKQKRKTEVIDKTLNPKWYQKMLFYTQNEKWEDDIKIQVFDHDDYSDHDPLGEVVLKATEESQDMWVTLNKVKQGEIHLQITFRALKEGEEILFEAEEDETDPELVKNKERGETYWPLKGSVYPPTNFTYAANHLNPPSPKLQLEFIHGYRGHDCRDNLFFNSKGDLVFNAAAVGVTFNLESRTQSFYIKHDDDVVCLTVSWDGSLVATGQVCSLNSKKPRILVWNSETRETLQEIVGFHTRSICAVAFSQDKEYLMSVGTDDHNSVALYNWKKNQLLASSYGGSNKVLQTKFYPNENSKFVTIGIKHVKFWNYENGKLNSKDGTFKKFSIQTLVSADFGSNNELITGTYGGELYFWSGTEVVKSIKVQDGPNFALKVTNFGIVTGGKNGKVNIYSVDDPQEAPILTYDLNAQEDKLTPSTIRCIAEWKDTLLAIGTSEGEIYTVNQEKKNITPVLQGHNGEVWGCASSEQQSIYVTTGGDKSIRLWDIESKSMIKAALCDSNAVCAAFSADGNSIATGHEDGLITIFNSKTLEIKHKIKDKKVKIDVVSFSPDGDLLASGSHDSTIDIYAVTQNYSKIITFKGHTSYVSHLDWSKDSKVIQSDSGSYEHLFWDVEEGKQLTRSTAVRNLAFETYTCTLGWPVKGIWPKGADGTDINALCRSCNSDLVATSDDSSLVKIFRYPVDMNAKFREYRGHSSHVANVKFTRNDTHVVSCGGNDRTLFQWKVSGMSSNPLTESASENTKPEKVEPTTPIKRYESLEIEEKPKKNESDEIKHLKEAIKDMETKLETLQKEKENIEHMNKHLSVEISELKFHKNNTVPLASSQEDRNKGAEVKPESTNEGQKQPAVEPEKPAQVASVHRGTPEIHPVEDKKIKEEIKVQEEVKPIAEGKEEVTHAAPEKTDNRNVEDLRKEIDSIKVAVEKGFEDIKQFLQRNQAPEAKEAKSVKVEADPQAVKSPIKKEVKEAPAKTPTKPSVKESPKTPTKATATKAVTSPVVAKKATPAKK